MLLLQGTYHTVIACTVHIAHMHFGVELIKPSFLLYRLAAL